MSYPSAYRHLEEMGVTLEDASDDQLHKAYIKAFQEDLPLGWKRVNELVAKLREQIKSGADRAMLTLDPGSPEGQQFSRLLGFDIPRKILERHFGVFFGIYNCCKGAAAEDEKSLKMSIREQLEAQHPQFVDC